MTRRRDVPTLAFTVPEAAEAIRLSENTLRVWIKEGIVRVVRWQSLDLVPRVELDRLILDALDNGGTLPAVAMASPSHGSAAVVEGEVIGAAGPVVRPVPGKAGMGTTSAPARGLVRPAAPTTKARAGAATPTLTTSPA